MTVETRCSSLPLVAQADLEGDAYHADTTLVSHSMLEVFRQSVPLYAARFVHKTLPAPEPTPAMRLGTLLHAALLEPERWKNRIIAPKVDRRTAAGKKTWQEHQDYCDNHPGLLLVDADEQAAVSAMADACRLHPTLAAILEAPGHCERPLRWVDADTGVACKCRPDKVCESGLVLDLKTTADPSPAAFARACVNFGYARQDAHYLEGCWAFCGADGPFVFGAVGKEPPHEVVAYTLDAEARGLARRQNKADLAALAACRRDGQWSSRWPQVQSLTLPKWAFYE